MLFQVSVIDSRDRGQRMRVVGPAMAFKKKRPLGTVQHVLDTHDQALHIACIIDFKQANIFGCVCI